MRIKTRELTEQGLMHVLSLPDLSWQTCGPIIEREGISTMFHDQGHWTAANLKGTVSAEGPTPLIAAMRCYCCSKLGDVVDVPEELCQAQNS